MPIPLALLLAFLLVSLLVGALLTLALRGERALRRRVEALTELEPPRQEGGTSRDNFPSITRLLTGRGYGDRLKGELARAGLLLRPSEFVALTLVCMLLFMLAGLLLTGNAFASAGIGGVGYVLPRVILKTLQAQRKRRFDGQIADALTLISSSLRSGYSFLRALQVVSDEMPPPISEEFGRVIGQVNLGASMDEALKHMVSRVRSYDLDLVVTAVLIQLQVGGNLAEILETIAETIRERVRIMGEIATLTAEGRISGLILFLLPIGMAIILTILNRAYMAPLLASTAGHFMIGAALLLQILGGLVIKRMLAVDI